jgi:hypothetical protein
MPENNKHWQGGDLVDSRRFICKCHPASLYYCYYCQQLGSLPCTRILLLEVLLESNVMQVACLGL